MEALFSHLQKESNKKIIFEKKVFDVIPGHGAFHQQPHYVKKIVRREHVLMRGKPTVVRRVYCRSEEFGKEFVDYENIGWVLFTDVQNCMLVSEHVLSVCVYMCVYMCVYVYVCMCMYVCVYCVCIVCV
jgi:hypothetical protein